MKKLFPRAFSALNSSVLSTLLLVAPVYAANSVDDYTYNPSVDLSTRLSSGRKIGEFNYMFPLVDSGNHLPIFDLKLKLDDKQSKEINAGFVYRYNHEDRAIFGAYAYFDHRITGNNLSVSELTLGGEILSKYIDFRANIYIPQNKRKKLKNKNNNIKGTSIFAMPEGDQQHEAAMKGYDIEVGVPVFGFSDDLNEKFGTKIFAARYNFSSKNIKAIIGNRFRLEQTLGETWLGDDSYKFYIGAETQYDKARKRQNFVNLGLKITFNDKKNSRKSKKTGLQHRMMDTVIRDVDVPTAAEQAAAEQLRLARLARLRAVAQQNLGGAAVANGAAVQAAQAAQAAQVQAAAQAAQAAQVQAAARAAQAQAPVIHVGQVVVAMTPAQQAEQTRLIRITRLRAVAQENAAAQQAAQVAAREEQAAAAQRQQALAVNAWWAQPQVVAGAQAVRAQGGIDQRARDQMELRAGVADAFFRGQGRPLVFNAGNAGQANGELNIPDGMLDPQEVAAQEAMLAQFGADFAQAVERGDPRVIAEQEAIFAQFAAERAQGQQPGAQGIAANANGAAVVQPQVNGARGQQPAAQVVAQQPQFQPHVAGAPNVLTPASLNNIIDPLGIDRATLSPAEQSFYDILIRQISTILPAGGNNNLYVKRQIQYDEVAAIIAANPVADIDEIRDIINARYDLSWEDREHYKDTASKIFRFDGTFTVPEQEGVQQGIGAGHRGIKDLTATNSLERLRSVYGVLDGDQAVNIVESFIVALIRKDMAPLSVEQAKRAAADSGRIEPDWNYNNAMASFDAAVVEMEQIRARFPAPPNETPMAERFRTRLRELALRDVITRKNAARASIDTATKTSITSVNNTLAAYRAVNNRIKPSPNGVFTEEILGRYNVKEMLAYAVIANLDFAEAQRNLVLQNTMTKVEHRIVITKERIFERQMQNIEGLIINLGKSQRSYNMDYQRGALDRGGMDHSSCAHGVGVRVVDSMTHHSKVSLSDASPASFADEFNEGVKKKVLSLVTPAQKLEIDTWVDSRGAGDVVKIDYANNRINFSTPVHEGNERDIPDFYKNILSDVAAEMDIRYNFTSPDLKRQLVKKLPAEQVLQAVSDVDLGQ